MLPESAIHDSRPARGYLRRQAERMVRRWNRGWPSGTPVLYWNLYGDPPIETATRGEAFVSAAGVPVIFVERVSGYVSLYHVLPASERPPGVPLVDVQPQAWHRPPAVAEAECDVDVEDLS